MGLRPARQAIGHRAQRHPNSILGVDTDCHLADLVDVDVPDVLVRCGIDGYRGHVLSTGRLGPTLSSLRMVMTAHTNTRTSLLCTMVVVGLVLGTAACASPGQPIAVAQGQDGVAAISVGDVTSDGTVVIVSAAVEDAIFFIGKSADGSTARAAASFAGSDPGENWEAVETQADVPPKDLTVAGAMNFGDADPGELATINGQVGADVTALDIITQKGETIAADVRDGRWIAAWSGADFRGRDQLDATLVVHLSDGSTETVSYLDKTAG